MDEEEDSIVQEIPVYLSQTLSKELYVFQYPLRSAKEGWENAAVLNSRIKPVHQEVKLEFGLDTDSDRYSTSKGEQIALNTDGVKPSHVLHKEKDKNAYFKSGIMDKLQYASNTPVTDASKYAVAILQDGEMHFTPLNGIVQLRPSYSYFDKENKRLKEEEHEKSGAEEEAGGSGGAGSSMEPEAKQVTVTFARTESDRIKMAREKSFGYLAKKSAEEPWCEATWWHSNSDKAELERLKLFAAANSGMSDMGLDLGAAEYLGALVPPDEESRAALAPGQASDVINLNEIKKLPLPEQCKIILKDAKLVTVGWLSSVLGFRGPTLLSALSGAGRLVSKGRWAARSDLLYPPGSLSRASGLSHILMCRARDYALYLFTQSDYVDRRKFTAAVKLPPEEVREILSSVAHIKPNKGWELLIPPDLEFGEKYPDIEQRQALLWEAMQRQFNEMLSGEPATPKRQRKKSQRDSFSSDNGGMPSPKVRSNSVSFSPRESFSDNESGGDSKKMAKNNLKGCKKTHSTGGGHSNFNSSDKRVS